jgi:hypothetical protein
MTLYATLLWLYAVMASVVFGASVYESLVKRSSRSRHCGSSRRGSHAPAKRQRRGAG